MTKAPYSDDILQKIQLRAYFIWERHGRPHGQERAHWSEAEAEAEVLQDLTKTPRTMAKAAAKAPTKKAALKSDPEKPAAKTKKSVTKPTKK
jgi:hypothetical protein